MPSTVAWPGTVAGPQHATFRFDLGGREDLVLTAPGLANDRMGHLEIASAGSWLVQRGSADGPVATTPFRQRRVFLLVIHVLARPARLDVSGLDGGARKVVQPLIQ